MEIEKIYNLSKEEKEVWFEKITKAKEKIDQFRKSKQTVFMIFSEAIPLNQELEVFCDILKKIMSCEPIGKLASIEQDYIEFHDKTVKSYIKKFEDLRDLERNFDRLNKGVEIKTEDAKKNNQRLLHKISLITMATGGIIAAVGAGVAIGGVVSGIFALPGIIIGGTIAAAGLAIAIIGVLIKGIDLLNVLVNKNTKESQSSNLPSTSPFLLHREKGETSTQQLPSENASLVFQN